MISGYSGAHWTHCADIYTHPCSVGVGWTSLTFSIGAWVREKTSLTFCHKRGIKNVHMSKVMCEFHGSQVTRICSIGR